MKVKPIDGIAIGFCAHGQRRFCLAHGLDVRRFFKEGLDDSEVAHLDDAHVKAMVEQARKREVKDGA